MSVPERGFQSDTLKESQSPVLAMVRSASHVFVLYIRVLSLTIKQQLTIPDVSTALMFVAGAAPSLPCVCVSLRSLPCADVIGEKPVHVQSGRWNYSE